MMNKLPCHVVRDLLPMLADDLLSPQTEQDVRAHLSECEACSLIYKQMTEPEPEIEEDAVEVDYLRKVKHSWKKILIGAAVIVAVVAAGALINAKIQAAKADIRYDESSRTMVIYGKDDTDLKLPDTVNLVRELDAQFDTFHARVNLPLLRTGEEDLATYLPAYLGRTNQSIKFIRSYLKENCPDIDLADRAEKLVELSVLPDNEYTWSEVEDRIELDIGDYYWHREEMYVLALLGEKEVQWKQLGYAWYLGVCIDPYNEVTVNGLGHLENEPYYEAFLRGGGTEDPTPENYKLMNDAVSYLCLTKDMNWAGSTAYESMPLYETALYSGPKKSVDPGNGMSVMMATSFIAYLSEQYGFDTVSAFCFGDSTFEEAFGTDWQSAYDSWNAWILETYGE